MPAKLFIFFTALGLCAAPVGAAVSPGLTILSGNGQAVFEFQRTTAPLVVQVRDAQGAPVPNASVVWAIVKGQGTLNGTVTSTDANGLASTYFVGTATYPESFTTQAITATAVQGSATFYVTSILSRNLSPMPVANVVSPAFDTPTLSGIAGGTLPAAIKVQVVAASGIEQGQPVPNIGIRLVERSTNPLHRRPVAQARAESSSPIPAESRPATLF